MFRQVLERPEQWLVLMRQLRPQVAANDISALAPFGYRFVEQDSGNDMLGAGAFFQAASLTKGQYNYLADLVVAQGSRSQGIGSTMMHGLLALGTPWALDSGLQRVDAHRFYTERHGFTHSGYAVRTLDHVFTSADDLSNTAAYINGLAGFSELSDQHRDGIKDFVRRYAVASSDLQADLGLFMTVNPGHNMLVLYNEQRGDVNGVLSFDLQRRLSIGGNCLHVEDIIVKADATAEQHEAALLVSLVAHARSLNAENPTDPIKSVIVEMTGEQLCRHEMADADPKLAKPETSSGAGSPAIKIRPNMNQLFSATAKHFTHASSDGSNAPKGSWYRPKRA